MAFGDRWRAWQAARQTPSDYEAIDDYFTLSPSEQQVATQYGGGTTIWPNDWYLGKNLGLNRFEMLQLIPGIGGRAAAILGGKGQDVPLQTTTIPAKDYTPLYVIAGAVVLIALMKK